MWYSNDYYNISHEIYEKGFKSSIIIIINHLYNGEVFFIHEAFSLSIIRTLIDLNGIQVAKNIIPVG